MPYSVTNGRLMYSLEFRRKKLLDGNILIEKERDRGERGNR